MDVTEIVMPGEVEPDGLQIRTRPAPAPAAGQVLLRMEASGISFAEQQMRKGRYYDMPTFPFVPGYDVVGVVQDVGPGGDPGLLGGRYAAVTKTGGWASHVIVDAGDLLPVPAGLDPAAVETLLVNGITAWQMLEFARVPRGGTIVVLGANGGVGSTLVQLARHAGITVIGTASARHHDTVRRLGATPVDYRDPDQYEQIARLAPGGVDAVFDHVGGAGLARSWKLVRRGGALVAYGNASAKDTGGGALVPFVKLIGRILLWNALPNGRRAHFYNFWAGKARKVEAYRARQREAAVQLLGLLADGVIEPQIAARLPLSETVSAFELAESGTVAGKVVLVADA